MNRAAAWRVGMFVLFGTAVLVLAVLWVSRDWFGASEKVQLRFEGSVFGLQAGAPVVLRGVRVGQVLSIGLDAGASGVPVQAELDRAALSPLVPAASSGPLAPALVQRGLVATLATQSLLTGLLYVDLDFDKTSTQARVAAKPGELTEVPTRPAALAALQQQLAQVDLGRIGADLQQLASSARRVVAQPEAEQALVKAARAAAALEALAAQMQKDWQPLARSAAGVLDSSRQSLREITPAAVSAARDVSAAASSATGVARGLGQDGRAALAAVRVAGDELARAAQQLGQLTAADGALAVDAQRAMGDVSRAARSLRELADLLERHPDALLRGRQENAR